MRHLIMNARRTQGLAVMLGVLLLGLSYGCAKPPTKEMADAEAAVTAAKLAEADIYVPQEYQSAEEMLAQAKAEVEQKEYEQAKNSAIQTIALAEKAREHAISAKQEAKVKAEEIIGKFKTALQEAKDAEALTYYAADYNRLSGTLGEMESDYAAEKYLAVIAKGEKALAEAKQLAASSRLAAAEAARRKAEEEARLARLRAEEEARRRAEEEARRRAEEERRLAEERARAKPPNHLVAKGECLWVISEYEKIYNDPFQWPLIYKANRSQIRDPDLIFPDQNFKIPRNASADEVKEAVYMAKHRGPWSLHDGK
jgi:nucleoid-associated protein YgaU